VLTPLAPLSQQLPAIAVFHQSLPKSGSCAPDHVGRILRDRNKRSNTNRGKTRSRYPRSSL
jgi:hypothetical protein